MKTIDNTIEDFCKENGITFQLAAINGDGEVVAKYSSEFDASDVAGYAGLLDEKIMQMAIADANDKAHEEIEEEEIDTAFEAMFGPGDWRESLNKLSIRGK